MDLHNDYTPTTEDYYRDDRESDKWEAIFIWAFRGTVVLLVFTIGFMAGWLSR